MQGLAKLARSAASWPRKFSTLLAAAAPIFGKNAVHGTLRHGIPF
jgi:hypothetical protein